MTGINLALRNLYGVVLWGNSLAGEVKLGYRTGFNLAGGFIRLLEPGELRRPVVPDAQPDTPEPPPMRELPLGRIAVGCPGNSHCFRLSVSHNRLFAGRVVCSLHFVEQEESRTTERN